MTKTIAIIGGGPAGLMAAEILSAAGHHVDIYEKKPSVARKFLMAGRGGLNLTHSEDLDSFIQKYAQKADALSPLIHNFTPQNLRAWCEGLGEKTFIGSSGRVFPESFKASPLLRAWTKRLQSQGVKFHLNHEWLGWDNDNRLLFRAEGNAKDANADATLLALGGASWPRLGSDGTWAEIFKTHGIETTPLRPSNCGFFVNWTAHFADRFQGHPLKPITLSFEGHTLRGEMMITQSGVEGGAIYALSAPIRETIATEGIAVLHVDLKPDLSTEDIKNALKKPRGKMSFSTYLKKTLKLSDETVGLIMERPDRTALGTYSNDAICSMIKSHSILLNAPFPIDRAISSAGGVPFEAVNDKFMLKEKPSVFVAGEMLDWEAPTGGYLLQACMASGVFTAQSIIEYLK